METSQEQDLHEDNKLVEPEPEPKVDDVKGKDDGEGKDNDKGKSEKGKVHVPPEGSKRWNDIYAKAKRYDEVKDDIEAMRQHNEELSDTLKTAISSQSENKEKKVVNDIQSRIAYLKAERKKAAAETDFGKMTEIGDEIDDLKEMLALNNKNTAPDIDVKAAIKQADDEKIIQRFIKDNTWFNTKSPEFDEIMYEAACALDTKLIPTFKGTLEERLEHVKEKIEARLGIENKGNGRGKIPSVQGVGGYKGKEGSAKIELSDDERRVAHNLFPDDATAEKRYYDQKMIIQKSKGGK